MAGLDGKRTIWLMVIFALPFYRFFLWLCWRDRRLELFDLAACQEFFHGRSLAWCQVVFALMDFWQCLELWRWTKKKKPSMLPWLIVNGGCGLLNHCWQAVTIKYLWNYLPELLLTQAVGVPSSKNKLPCPAIKPHQDSTWAQLLRNKTYKKERER